MKPKEAQIALRADQIQQWIDSNRTRYEGAKATITLVPVVNAAMDAFALASGYGAEDSEARAVFLLGQIKARLELATADMRFIRYYEERVKQLDSMQRGTPPPDEGA